MKFFLALLAIILLTMLYFVLRFFIKRLRLRAKVKKLCRVKGFTLFTNRKLWWLSGNHKKSCDFAIKTKDRLYSVKLFSMPRYMTGLLIAADGTYKVKHYFNLVSRIGSSATIFFDSKKRTMPQYDFRAFDNGIEDNIVHCPIFLLHPCSIELVGKPTFDCEIFSLSEFLGTLQHEE